MIEAVNWARVPVTPEASSAITAVEASVAAMSATRPTGAALSPACGPAWAP
jgi:hypothetical protein